ncbi:MAG: GAF domain-containing protein [Myxococcota bacterium]
MGTTPTRPKGTTIAPPVVDQASDAKRVNGRVARPKPQLEKDGPRLLGRIRELETELSELHIELERSERRVEAMKQIGRVLGSNLELDPLLLEIVRRTTELLEADRTTLFLAGPNHDELWSKVMEGEELKEIRLSVGSGVAGWVAEHGEPQHIADAYSDERFNPEIDRRSGYKTRCMLVWPVRGPQSSEILGVVQVLNKLQGPFNSTDERLLEAIASEIGVALEVSRLYREAVERSEALERARRELSLLFETERAISQSTGLSEMLNTILDTALTSMDAKSGAIHVLDDRGLRLEVTAARGTYAASLQRTSLQVGEELVGNVMKTGEPVVLNNIEGMQRGRIRAKSVLAVPIKTKYAGNIGVFELINRRDKNGFSEPDVNTLAVVAAQAGRAINAERRRKEREQSERLTTIGRMLSGVIHDIRTPMGLISGYTDMMTETEDQDERARYAHMVNKQIDVLSAMTGDLLAFARGERNVLIRKVYLYKFIGEMKDHLAHEFEDSGVELTVEDGYRGVAYFDETKLRRVFHNIARNAREAMPEGGRFDVRAEQDGDDLLFHFDDTGGGVPSELADRLFEPFATSGKVGGTGLGLAMVKQIADEHHGSVSYETSGEGTRFTFCVPLKRPM